MIFKLSDKNVFLCPNSYFQLSDKRFLGSRNIMLKCYAFYDPAIEPLFEKNKVSGPTNSDSYSKSLGPFPATEDLKPALDHVTANIDRAMSALIEGFMVNLLRF